MAARPLGKSHMLIFKINKMEGSYMPHSMSKKTQKLKKKKKWKTSGCGLDVLQIPLQLRASLKQGASPPRGSQACWSPLLFLIPPYTVEVWGSPTDTRKPSTPLHPLPMRSSQLRPVSALLFLDAPVPSREVLFWPPAPQHKRC